MICNNQSLIDDLIQTNENDYTYIKAYFSRFVKVLDAKKYTNVNIDNIKQK